MNKINLINFIDNHFTQKELKKLVKKKINFSNLNIFKIKLTISSKEQYSSNGKKLLKLDFYPKKELKKEFKEFCHSHNMKSNNFKAKYYFFGTQKEAIKDLELSSKKIQTGGYIILKKEIILTN